MLKSQEPTLHPKMSSTSFYSTLQQHYKNNLKHAITHVTNMIAHVTCDHSCYTHDAYNHLCYTCVTHVTHAITHVTHAITHVTHTIHILTPHIILSLFFIEKFKLHVM